MPKLRQTYHDRFIKAVRYWMADNDISELKEAAECLEIPYINFYKIMQKANKPSVELCAKICSLGGFSGNWLFLGKGEEKTENLKIAEELKTLQSIIKKK